jgi:hypothetical protein
MDSDEAGRGNARDGESDTERPRPPFSKKHELALADNAMEEKMKKEEISIP